MTRWLRNAAGALALVASFVAQATVAITHLDTTADTTNTPNATAAFVPTANSLQVVCVNGAATVENPATITNSTGLTYTQIGTYLDVNSGSSSLYLFVANATSSAVSQTITFDPVDQSTGTVISTYEITGITKVGSSAIRQSKTRAAITGSDATPDATFSNAVLTGNPTLGCAVNVTNPAGLTPPTGWTEGSDTGHDTPTIGFESAWRLSGFTGTNMAWGTSASNWGVTTAEIDSLPPIVLVTAVPTPGGIVSSKYRDGDDGGATSPSKPVLGQPTAVGSTQLDITLATASTGGSGITYTLEMSSTSALTGFSVLSSDAYPSDVLYSKTGLTASTQYWFRTKATNSTPRESLYSDVVTGTTNATAADVTAPALNGASGGLAITPSTNTASLTWLAASDAIGVAGYNVWRGTGDGAGGVATSAVLIANVGNVLAFQDSGLTSAQEYYWRLAAYDAAGNTSASGTRIFATTTTPAAAFTTVFYWDHEGETVNAAAPNIANVWQGNIDANAPYYTQLIKNAVPFGTHGKYIEFMLQKNGANNFRNERAVRQYFGWAHYADPSGASDNGIEMTPLGVIGGKNQFVAAKDYWYGFEANVIQVDDNIDSVMTQFHTWQSAPDNHSPLFGLNANNAKIWIKVKQNDDAVPGPNEETDLLLGANAIGTAHKYAIQIRWDTRTAAQGSIGVYRMWIDNCAVPAYEWVNKQTDYPPEHFIPQWKIGFYKARYKTEGTNGATNIDRFDTIRVDEGDSSCANVMPP